MRSRGCKIEYAASVWLARRDSGNWADDDQSALELWLDDDAANRVAFLRLEAAWQDAGRLKVLDIGTASGEVPARGAWAASPFFDGFEHAVACDDHGEPARTPPQARPKRWGRAVGLAAALALLAVLAGSYVWYADTHVHWNQWQTAVGTRQAVHLADGSTVTLAGNSAIRTLMRPRERNIRLLRGEAFFDVAKDHSRPFVVHAGGYQVIAVGTRFDVRRDGENMRVVVERGLVRLQQADSQGQAATRLPAGSVALVDGDSVTVQTVSAGQVRAYLSWRSGYVVFAGTPLAKAVIEFNRYNMSQIVIGDPALAALRVGGHFRLDNSDAFVRVLQQVFPIRVEHRGRKVILLPRQGETTAN